jgi:hypothetical protein
MSVELQTVRCGNCDLELEEAPGTPVDERRGCPRCGSMSRHFSLSISESVTVHGMLELKGRHATGGRPFNEQKVGDELHRKSGRWMRLERVIDRAKNWYREVVTDHETGKIVHQCDEPLSDHQGHGTAKKTPKRGAGDDV